jgi:hypothetical protein
MMVADAVERLIMADYVLGGGLVVSGSKVRQQII